MALTAKDVLNARFASPVIGRRGYRPATSTRSCAGSPRPCAAGTVSPRPTSGRRTSASPSATSCGYSEDEVDAFLDVVEAELTRRLLDD